MVSLHQLVAFGLVALVVIAIPGPSVVFVIGRALAYGRSVALATVLGNALGFLTTVVLVAVGLGVVVQESALVFVALKFAGAAYLVWLGVEAVRRRREFLTGDSGLVGTTMGPARALRQGYVVGISNPKGYLLFAAVLPQFVHRADGQVQLQMALLASRDGAAAAEQKSWEQQRAAVLEEKAEEWSTQQEDVEEKQHEQVEEVEEDDEEEEEVAELLTTAAAYADNPNAPPESAVMQFELPVEVVHRVFAYLDPDSIGYAAMVSGIGLSMRSKARRWVGVGSVSLSISMSVWW